MQSLKTTFLFQIFHFIQNDTHTGVHSISISHRPSSIVSDTRHPSPMTHPTIQIVPSILSADFARLGEQVREAEEAGADRIQVDVMDGHFVPNITVGPVVLKAIRSYTSLPIEAHLMIERPELYIPSSPKPGLTSSSYTSRPHPTSIVPCSRYAP